MTPNPDIATGTPPATPSPGADAYWRPMHYWNLYRLIVAGLLLSIHFLVRKPDWQLLYDTLPYFRTALAYLLFAAGMGILTFLHRPRFERQVALHAIGDILFIVMLMHAAGGIQSGLGVLLVITIVGAALVSAGRLALFYAAIASIALLLEQSFQILSASALRDDYSQSAMLSLSCFATAWLAFTLGRRMRQSEALASQRSIDLQNMNQVNQRIIQEMQDGVLVVDDHFILRHLNARAENLLGKPAEACINVALQDCAPELVMPLRDWMAQTGRHAGVARQTSHGTELRLRFLPVGTDRSQGAVVFIEDWSRVQAQARQLKLASLGALTANIAHEIRNPLSAISHADQLLLEDPHQDATGRRLLQIIHQNVQRLDKIVQDVLQLNRRDRIQQENIRLAEFLREFHDQFCASEQIPPSGLQLLLDSEHAATLFDRSQLNQVLWNLCRNGWRHCRQQQGSLRLRLGRAVRQGEIMLEITDDGPGIPPEVRAHLFEPFYTTESTGTGLGLYIARELCEANDATLRHIETAEGAQFRIYLKHQHA